MKKFDMDKFLDNEEGNSVQITHSADLDGVGSVLTVLFCQTILDNIIEVIGLNYGKEVEEFDIEVLRGKDVLITDFSFNRETTEKIAEIANSLLVIDHHASAEKELIGLDYVIIDKTHSAAKLVFQHLRGYKYLFPDILVDVINYIEDRDIWKWELDNSKEINAFLYLKELEIFRTKEDRSDISKYHDFLVMVLSFTTIQDLVVQGRLLETKSNLDVMKIVNSNCPNYREFSRGDKGVTNIYDDNGIAVSVPCINNATEVSKVGNVLATKALCSIQYFIKGKECIVSLRSTEGGLDVSKLAKVFGGGGHSRASSFRIPLSSTNIVMDLIVHKKLSISGRFKDYMN